MGRGRMTSGGGGRGGMTSGGGFSRGSGHRHSTIIIGPYHHGHHHSSGSPIAGILVGVLFAFVGLFIMCIGFSLILNVFNYSKVNAVCVANEENKVDGGYFARYNFIVDGISYKNVRSNQSWVAEEDVGAEVVIYYLEEDPKQIYEERPVNVGEGVMIAGFGLLFAVFGTIPIVVCIKEIKRKKNSDHDFNSEELSPIKEEIHNKCPYCGSKYKKTSDSCPKCGASRTD